jgi:hypothetical protein
MRCPHCNREIFKKKALIVEHNGEMISLRELSRVCGIAYSTLQGRYDRGYRGKKLLGPVDVRRSSNRAKKKEQTQPPPRSEVSGLMRQFMSGGST